MPQITEDTFENFLSGIKGLKDIDIRDMTFIDPYGMVGILEIGELSNISGNYKPLFLPTSEDVIKYLERMDFFKFVDKYFSLEPSKPQISRTINGFIVALSEVCQNIIEHSETTGFVGIQKYHFQNINKGDRSYSLSRITN